MLLLDEGNLPARLTDAANIPRPNISISDVVAVDDHKQLLALYPDSPFRNCAIADQLIAENSLEAAESHYRRAIEFHFRLRIRV